MWHARPHYERRAWRQSLKGVALLGYAARLLLLWCGNVEFGSRGCGSDEGCIGVLTAVKGLEALRFGLRLRLQLGLQPGWWDGRGIALGHGGWIGRRIIHLIDSLLL